MSKPPLGLLQRLRTSLQKNEMEKIREWVMKTAPFEVAWCLGRLPLEETVRVLAVVPPETGAEIFQQMDLTLQTQLLQLGRLPSLVNLLSAVNSNKVADVLGALDPVHRTAWLLALPAQEMREAESLLAYDPDTAGGMMAKEYVSVPLHLTAGEVASRLQALASSYANIKVTYVYVVDEKGLLKGVLPVRDLIFRSRETPIETFMVRDVSTILDAASKKEVAELFQQQKLLALPVVTSDGRLVGVIRVDDVMDLIRNIAEGDVLKLSGVSTDESRDAPLQSTIRRRLSWLTLNIILDLIAASVIGFYLDTISSVIALAFFLPIISDMSGCSGMQSVAVSIRDLALQKILPSEYKKVLWKELLVGFLNGFALGVIVGLVAFFLKGNVYLGVIVAISLWLNNIIAVCIGGVIPLLIKHFKFDPAIGSGPILTTVTDLMGFFILLSLATLWLPWLKT